MTNQNEKSKQAFTLIELLIVIAIIAILAGMLLPALNKARQKARTLQCVGNMRQMGVCAKLYMEDNKDFLTPNYDHGGNSNIPGTPHYSLLCSYLQIPSGRTSYGDNVRIYYTGAASLWIGKLSCPDLATYANSNNKGNNEYNSYQLNSVFHVLPTKISSIKNTSQLMYLGENHVQSSYSKPMLGYAEYNYLTYALGPRHEQNSNILYVDGHVSPVRAMTIRNWKTGWGGNENKYFWGPYPKLSNDTKYGF